MYADLGFVGQYKGRDLLEIFIKCGIEPIDITQEYMQVNTLIERRGRLFVYSNEYINNSISSIFWNDITINVHPTDQYCLKKLAIEMGLDISVIKTVKQEINRRPEPELGDVNLLIKK